MGGHVEVDGGDGNVALGECPYVSAFFVRNGGGPFSAYPVVGSATRVFALDEFIVVDAGALLGDFDAYYLFLRDVGYVDVEQSVAG